MKITENIGVLPELLQLFMEGRGDKLPEDYPDRESAGVARVLFSVVCHLLVSKPSH